MDRKELAMYCRSCGKTIQPYKAQCPFCGKDNGALSGGTGFWDLLERPTERIGGSGSTDPEEHQERKNGIRTLNIGLAVLLVLLLVTQIVSLISVVSLRHRIEEAERAVITLQGKQRILREDGDTIKVSSTFTPMPDQAAIIQEESPLDTASPSDSFSSNGTTDPNSLPPEPVESSEELRNSQSWGNNTASGEQSSAELPFAD